MAGVAVAHVEGRGVQEPEPPLQVRLSLLSPVYGSFVSISYMADPRQDHEAAPLPGGCVLVAGGKPNVNGVDTYLNRAGSYTQP